MTTIINFEEIATKTINSEYFEVSIWERGNMKRLYINRPGESKKYQKVGYVDLNTLKAFCEVNETRTSRGREYREILNNVVSAFKNAIGH